MISQDILWESMHSMHRFQQKYTLNISIQQFLVDLLVILSKELERNPFDIIMNGVKQKIQGCECFVIEVLNRDFGKVIHSTKIEENNHLWPLVGPLKRALDVHVINLFNVQYTPFIKTFPPIVNHGISSILAHRFELQNQHLLC